MDNSQVIMAVILLAVALLLLFAEVLIPSGGLLGFLAAVALISGVVLMFRVDTTMGLAFALVAIIAVPFVIGFAMKILPNTPIGRLLILKSPKRDVKVRDDLVGTKGTAISDLHPVGICMINGQREECLADTGVIEAGAHVCVVFSDGMQIKVRVDEEV